MGFGVDLLKNVMTRARKLLKSESAHHWQTATVCLTKNRRRRDHTYEPHAKFGENRWRIVGV